MKAAKRKLLTDCDVEILCCRKLSVFACACAVLSLLVHTYNYVENGAETSIIRNVLDQKLKERIDEYLAEIGGTTPRRAKRDAMLVCHFLSSTLVISKYQVSVMVHLLSSPG